MTRYALIVAMALALLVAGPLPAAKAEMPEPDAEALWKYITETDPYTKWGQWPDFAGVVKSNSPHGPFVRVFVNKIGLGMTKPPAPQGMIEVKEGLDKDNKIRNITVQYKVGNGYNPDGGDWFWAKYSPEGKADAAGKVGGCIRCHKGGGDNDYITAHEFK